MTKADFIKKVRRNLKGMNRVDRESSLEYIGEMIDDRIEGGMTEVEAVADMGDYRAVASGIVAESGRPERKKLSSTVKVLLIVGSPLWISVAAVLAGIAVSLAAAAASILISLAAADIALASGALGGAAACVISAVRGDWASALFTLGCGAMCAGLAIMLFAGMRSLMQAIVRAIRNIKNKTCRHGRKQR